MSEEAAHLSRANFCQPHSSLSKFMAETAPDRHCFTELQHILPRLPLRLAAQPPLQAVRSFRNKFLSLDKNHELRLEQNTLQ